MKPFVFFRNPSIWNTFDALSPEPRSWILRPTQRAIRQPRHRRIKIERQRILRLIHQNKSGTLEAT